MTAVGTLTISTVMVVLCACVTEPRPHGRLNKALPGEVDHENQQHHHHRRHQQQQLQNSSRILNETTETIETIHVTSPDDDVWLQNAEYDFLPTEVCPPPAAYANKTTCDALECPDDTHCDDGELCCDNGCVATCTPSIPPPAVLTG
ncbi:PREDICTED: uncharacterized protein LOC106812346 isoform X3 [Priapulus caudatus]|uniref:Uncharacterized protein LOC106812346 isoform X3 n=1 Tax=Priapulus caudatus TaxID=37621 RepID=A0ABM1EHL2_PRICU|nr:PREDICTED: uncharacterized protein LOC106812346 isoform X3 [Priapulus caudatus]